MRSEVSVCWPRLRSLKVPLGWLVAAATATMKEGRQGKIQSGSAPAVAMLLALGLAGSAARSFPSFGSSTPAPEPVPVEPQPPPELPASIRASGGHRALGYASFHRLRTGPDERPPRAMQPSCS